MILFKIFFCFAMLLPFTYSDRLTLHLSKSPFERQIAFESSVLTTRGRGTLSTFHTFQATTFDECKHRCNVERWCKTLSILPNTSSSTYECRTSGLGIFDAPISFSELAYTFYKTSDVWIPFDDGLLYFVNITAIATFEDAVDACASKGRLSRLAIFRTIDQIKFITSYAVKSNNHWVGLQKTNSSDPVGEWMDGTLYGNQKLSMMVAGYCHNPGLFYTLVSGQFACEYSSNAKYPFICQGNPSNIKW